MATLKIYPGRWITVKDEYADPIRFAGHMATPVARVVRIRLPLAAGQIVWIRPTWILAAGLGSVHQRLRIRDFTRQVCTGLLGLTLSVGFGLWSRRRYWARASQGGSE
jgi:hypothetical protein